MPTLDTLNDKQNHLLTQLSYLSDEGYLKQGETLEQAFREKKGSGKGNSENPVPSVLEELVKEGLGELKIQDVENDPSSGFGAVAFADASGNIGFSYRGTDGIEDSKDMIDNLLTFASGISPQSLQALAFFEKNKASDGMNFGYGHSKGGELIQYVFAFYSNLFQKVHLLNSQPINPYSLTPEQRIALISDKIDSVIIAGDYIWFLGAPASFNNIRIQDKKCQDPHLYCKEAYDAEGNIINGTQPWWEFPAYLLITSLTRPIQIIGGGIGFVYNCVKIIVDAVKNGFVPKAQAFVSSVVEHLRDFGAEVLEYANNLGQFLYSVVDRANDWFRTSFDTGYNYANTNPRISIETHKLLKYSQRLRDVNRRLVVLDGRIDKLYTEVGLLDLWNLITADIFTGYSWRINRCCDYMTDTANDFESIEASLIRSL